MSDCTPKCSKCFQAMTLESGMWVCAACRHPGWSKDMTTKTCPHGQLERQCELCEKDRRIAQLEYAEGALAGRDQRIRELRLGREKQWAAENESAERRAFKQDARIAELEATASEMQICVMDLVTERDEARSEAFDAHEPMTTGPNALRIRNGELIKRNLGLEQENVKLKLRPSLAEVARTCEERDDARAIALQWKEQAERALEALRNEAGRP